MEGGKVCFLIEDATERPEDGGPRRSIRRGRKVFFEW